jgi:hypothetical protein
MPVMTVQPGGNVGAVDAESITYALELHRAGGLGMAEAAYLTLLNVSAQHPDLLRLLTHDLDAAYREMWRQCCAT